MPNSFLYLHSTINRPTNSLIDVERSNDGLICSCWKKNCFSMLDLSLAS